MKQEVPVPLWVAIVTLGLISLLTFLSLLKGFSLVPLVTVACNIALMVGLYCGHKWAYIVTMVFSTIGVAFAFGKSASQGLAVLFGNGLVVVPVLLCTRFFFPAREESEFQPR
jgi:hypothetical protein